MKRIVIHFVTLTIFAATAISGTVHAQTPLACEFSAGLKIDNVNLLSATRVRWHYRPAVPLPHTGFRSSRDQFRYSLADPELEREILYGWLRWFLWHAR